MPNAKFLLVILMLVGLFVPARLAHADMAPPPAPQLGGLEPFQYQKTNVQMVYERVELELRPFAEADNEGTRTGSRVQVTVYFTMHNNGNIPEAMQAIFPLESFSDCIYQNEISDSYAKYSINADTFNVIVDGAVTSFEKVTTEHPYKNLVKDPNNCDQMTWAGFNVTFPVDQDVVIRVQYEMEPQWGDFMQNIEYILETGKGWAGPIKRGYVVVKFPYSATTENVLSDTTPGYQFLYNEIFWSFENLEPTSKDNIQVSIVSPDTWLKILSLRRDLKESPEMPDKWMSLIDVYKSISVWHGYNIRSGDYIQKAGFAYEQAISSNPNNAELYSNYAQFKLLEASPYLFVKLTNDQARPIIELLNKALALDPNDEIANQTLNDLMSVALALTFTPPPTIPPTATSQFTVTPSITPPPAITSLPTLTSLPTDEPFVVTVVQTKLVYAAASTPEPKPTVTFALTSTADISTQGRGGNSSATFFGVVIIFILGAGSGWLLSKRQKK